MSFSSYRCQISSYNQCTVVATVYAGMGGCVCVVVCVCICSVVVCANVFMCLYVSACMNVSSLALSEVNSKPQLHPPSYIFVLSVMLC